jgi:hypothetical protein
MSRAKQASKPKSRAKAVTAVVFAGALSLAGGASVTAVGPADHMPMANTAPAITLGEEQISDLRVATSMFSTTRTPDPWRGRKRVFDRTVHQSKNKKAPTPVEAQVGRA